MDTYTTKSGDAWDEIARTVYDDENRMTELLEANPEHVGTFIFPAGVVLNVPPLAEKRMATNLPIWRESK